MTTVEVRCPNCSHMSKHVVPPALDRWPTRKQFAVLRYVHGFIAERRMAPTYVEIAAGLGTVSKGAIARLVHGLVERGLIDCPFRSHRGITITERGLHVIGERQP